MRALGPIVATFTIEKAARDLLAPDRGLIGWYLDEITYQEAALAAGIDPQAFDRAACIAEIEDAGGQIDRVERPRSVRVRERIRKFADDQLPAIVLMSPGTTGDMGMSAGLYYGTWALGVTALVQTTDEMFGRELAGLLCTAACAVLENNLATIDTRVVSARMTAEATTDTDTDDARSRYACTRQLDVFVQDIAWTFATPPSLELIDPAIGQPAPDAGDLPTVETTEVVETPVEEIPA